MSLVRRLADAELVGEPELRVTEEGEARTQARLEGRLYARRINRDDCLTAVGDSRGLVELDQLPQLNLSLGSPGAAIEGEDQRLALGHLCGRHLALPVVD